MFEEIKKVKLNQIEQKRAQILKQKIEKEKRKRDLIYNLDELEYKKECPINYRRFNLLEKWITRRREYKNYQKEVKDRNELPYKINRIEKELEEEKKKIEKELEELGINQELALLNGKLHEIGEAKNLKDLGMKPKEAIEFLKEIGMTPILDESDKVITNNPRNYSSKDALIGVHKTQYPPIDSKIKTAKEVKKVTRKKRITINEQEYNYEVNSERDTVHMAMNDEVSSHMYGSWEDCKYAILIPMTDIPNEKIGHATPVDTFTKGSIKLTENSWILCPKGEVEEIKKRNFNVNVVGYEGDSVLGYPQPFLSSLGYRAEGVGMSSWGDKRSDEDFYDLMNKEGIKIGAHTYTHFHEDEKMLREINEAVAICKVLRDNNLVKEKEEIPSVMEQLEKQYSGLGRILRNLCITSEFSEEGYDLEAIKANHKHLDIFFDNMEKNGFNIATEYQTIIRKIEQVGEYKINTPEEIKSIFETEKEVTEEKKLVIEELKEGFERTPIFESENRNKIMSKFLSTVLLECVLESKDRKKEIEKMEDSNVR